MTEMRGVGVAADMIAGDQVPHRRIQRAEARHDCANCGTHLQGAYCHACGQKGHLHTRLWHMAEDFVEGVLHLDGRIWRTLPLLAFRPGRLSRAWIEGKRVRYLAPLHIFLFSIFVFFLTLSLTGGALFAPVFEGIARSSGAGTVTIGGESVACREAIEREGMAEAFCDRLSHIQANPKYYAYKAESTTYKLAPLLAPISMTILALLLVFKRGYTFYDHGIVALYGLGFLTLVTTLAMLANSALQGDWAGWVFLLILAHAVVHLRGAYRLSWVGAGVRTVLLGWLTSTVFSLFLFGVAAMSAA